MHKRSPWLWLVLGVITCDFLSYVWFVKTTRDMRSLGIKVPSCWFIALPLVNLWWVDCFIGRVEDVTGNRVDPIIALMLYVFHPLGIAGVQFELNKVVKQKAQTP